MHHFVLPARQSGKRFATTLSALADPLTPPSYLRLRRVAAGVTVDQLARALVTLDAHRRPLPKRKPSPAEQGRRFMRAKDTVALLERPGAVTRDHELLFAIASYMPFDPDVYRQLADNTPNRHPRICRSCGCSAHDACSTDDHVCAWVTPSLCSHCMEGGLRAATKVAA